jgi:7-cyano-7-deazaguanine synthase
MKKSDHQTATVLLSGGVDSAACAHFYLAQGVRVHPLFVSYEQPASDAELKSARAICKFYGIALRVVTVRGLRIPSSGEIPGRNLFLVTAALMSGGGESNLIALGVHAGTRYFDCSPPFTTLCEKLLEGYADGRTRIGAPFLKLNKGQVWSYCKQYHVPVHLAWSCEASGKKACGKCLSCRDRRDLLAGA